MVESHLVEGRQELEPGKPLEFGQSITDACLGWSDSPRCSPDSRTRCESDAGRKLRHNAGHHGRTAQQLAALEYMGDAIRFAAASTR
jgi:hypothetical protein